MTMGSTFTGEGVLVGPKEYGVYSAIARLVIVAFISDIAFRLVFAQRIGIFLISELSIGAGARAAIRSLYRPPYPAYPRLWACSLFALAFLVTRGLDVLVSTYFSARKEHSVKRYSHVSAADLSKRNLIAGTFVGALMNRSDVYSVLSDITMDISRLRQGQWWPEAVGMLTDAEIAAVTLARSPCVDVQDPTQPADNFDWMPTKFSPELMDNDMGQTFPFFGQEILFLDMSLDSACIPGCVATVPIPIGYLAAQPGRGPVSQISRRQIGLLVSASGDIDANDMECGLSPDDVSRWITQYQPRPRVAGEANSAGLWYNDYHMHPRDKMGFPQGKSTFFLFNATSDRRGDMLSFGGRIHRDPYGVRARIVTRSITAAAILRDDEIAPSSVPLDHAPSLACQDTQVPYFPIDFDAETFVDGRENPAAIGNSSTINPSLLKGPIKPIRQCTLEFHSTSNTTTRDGRQAILSSNATFFFDPGHRGTEICRTKLVRYPTARSWGIYPSDILSVMRFHDVRQADTESKATYKVKCMSRDATTGNPQSPRPEFAFLSNTKHHGFIADPALAHFNETTRTDPAGPQAVFLELIAISWIELAFVIVMAILLMLLGVWGDVAEMVALTMYVFGYRPTPPAILRKLDTERGTDVATRDRERRARLALGAAGLPLMEPIEYAAVQVRGGADPPLELRIIPVAWNAKEGDNVALQVAVNTDRPHSVGTEIVVVTSKVFGSFDAASATKARATSRVVRESGVFYSLRRSPLCFQTC